MTETLAPAMGWISTNASSKLLHLPLRCFEIYFTAFLDCGACHIFFFEELVNQISTITPKNVDPMPIRLADQSVMSSDHSFAFPIRFTLCHVCNIAFCVLPTLAHGMLLEWSCLPYSHQL